MSFIRSTLTVLISAALVCDLAALNPGAQPFRRSSRLGKSESSGIGGDVSCTGASSPSSPSSFSSSTASSSSASSFSASRTNNVRLKSAASIDPFSMETSRRIDNVHYSVYPNSFAKKMTSFDVYEALTTQASLGVKKLQDLPVKERLAIGLAESWKWFQWRLQENIRTATQSEDIRQELSNSFEKLRDIASGDSELGIAAAASSNLGMDDVEYEWGNIYREMSSEEDIYNDDKIDEYLWSNAMTMMDLEVDGEEEKDDLDDAALDAYYAMVDSGAFSSSSPLLVDYFLENDGDDDDLTDDDETGTPQYELIDTLIAEHFRSRRRNGDSGAGAE